MSRNHTCDVAIVGGGIAGSFLASLLRGASVTLLERLRTGSASPAIATLWPDALWLLDLVGVGRGLEATNLPRVSHVSFQRYDGSRVEGPVPTYLGRAYAVGPRRTTLLSALHEHVLSTSVDFRPSTRVESVEWNSKFRRWMLQLRDGSRQTELVAELLIAADGRFSSLAPMLHARRYDVRGLRNRLRFQYARAPLGSPLESEFRTYHGRSQTAAHGFIQPADAGEVGVGLEGTRTLSRRPAFVTELQGFDRLPADIADLQWLGRPIEVSLGSMWKQRSGAENSLLVGDAGLYMDPVTGQGVGNALMSAAIAFKAITRLRRSEGSWREIATEYVRDRDRYAAADFERAWSAAHFDRPGTPEGAKSSEFAEINRYTNKSFSDGTPRQLNLLLSDVLYEFPMNEVGGQIP